MTLMTLTLMTGFLDRNEMTALLMIFTQRWAVDLFMDEPAYYKGRLHVLYPMQLVTPSVVAIAVRMLMAICRIVFQVFIFFNVKC